MAELSGTGASWTGPHTDGCAIDGTRMALMPGHARDDARFSQAQSSAYWEEIE
ncbi:hypothetical protein THTE_2999 [Thermogutta terrifontis]|uniref:Uncharacterized protein n=1 Tax=Thermogutta terrifontis TaxID=1331910 RepID=A0A286RI06_9BACT|nr:hypothetical protein THTE_2999 [Thermogutta terrifontis]